MNKARFAAALYALSLCASLSAAPPLRVIGGIEAAPEQYPWVVSLQQGGEHFCGATLIAPYWLLTAAHCVDRFAWTLPSLPSGIVAVMNFTRLSATQQAERIEARYAYRHPEWSPHHPEVPHDVALISLSRPAATPFLPLASLQQPDTGEGAAAKVLGWGYTDAAVELLSDSLQVASLPLVSNATCQAAYSEYQIFDGQICAGLAAGGVDSCIGDSGGPLVAFDGQSWRHIGITSYGGHQGGIACGGVNAYGIYTRTSAYLDLIHGHVYAKMSFSELASSYHIGEQARLVLREDENSLRGNVDLWVGIVANGVFYFLSGTAQAPYLQQEPTPLLRGLAPMQTEHLLLDIPVGANLQGEFQFFALYNHAGADLDFAELSRNQASVLAQTGTQVFP